MALSRTYECKLKDFNGIIPKANLDSLASIMLYLTKQKIAKNEIISNNENSFSVISNNQAIRQIPYNYNSNKEFGFTLLEFRFLHFASSKWVKC